MANVVDITLRAKNEASRVVTGLANELGGLGSVIGRLSAGAGVFGGIAAGITTLSVAAGASAFKFADMVEQMGRLSERTGVSARDLDVMQTIIREGGGDAEALSSALGRLNKAIGEGNPLVKQLGLNTEDTGEAFLKLVGKLGQMQNDGKRTAIAMSLLGRGAGEIIADFSALGTTFDSTRERMIATGETMSGELRGAGVALDGQMDKLKRNWAIAWNTINSVTVPAAASVVGAINRIIAVLREGDVGKDFWKNIAGPGAETTAEAMARVAKETKTAEASLQELVAVQWTDSPLDALALKLFRPQIPKRIEEITLKIARLKAEMSELFKGELIGPVAPEEKGPAKADKETPREKHIKELTRLLGIGTEQAAMLVDKLDAVDAVAKRAALEKQLGISLMIGPPEPASNLSPEDANVLVNPSNAPDPKDAIAELPKTAKTAAVEWQTALAEMSTAAMVTNDLIGGAFATLSASIGDALVGIVHGSMGLAEAVGGIFRAMVDEMLRQLARLAAVAILKAILRLATAGASVGVEGSLDMGAASADTFAALAPGSIGPGSAMSALAPSGGVGSGTLSARSPGGTTNVTINAIDSRSINDAFNASNGVFAAFNQQLAAAEGF